MTIRDMIHRNYSFNTPSLFRHNTSRSVSLLQNEINRLFDSFFSDLAESSWGKEKTFPAINIIENSKHYVIEAALPGMSPEDIDISAANGFMTIKGEKTEKEQTEDENFLRHEVSYGSFQRTISLPETANISNADTSFKDGVLTIKIPKKTKTLHKPKKLQIKKAA